MFADLAPQAWGLQAAVPGEKAKLIQVFATVLTGYLQFIDRGKDLAISKT